MKKILLTLAVTALFSASSLNAASISLILNGSAGQFMLNDGTTLPTSGGVSVGFFTGAAPTDDAIKALTASTAYSTLVGLGFVDVRKATNTSQDWDYPVVGGGITFTPGGGLNELPTSKQLYVLAFDAGTFVSGTPANSFSGSTQWAVVKDNAAAYTTPTSNLTTSNIVLSTATGATEILVGSDGTGNNINLAAVPEPSRALLGMIGVVALFVRRRR